MPNVAGIWHLHMTLLKKNIDCIRNIMSMNYDKLYVNNKPQLYNMTKLEQFGNSLRRCEVRHFDPVKTCDPPRNVVSRRSLPVGIIQRWDKSKRTWVSTALNTITVQVRSGESLRVILTFHEVKKTRLPELYMK